MKQEKFNRILGAASIAIILGIASTTAAAAPTSCPSTGENADDISLSDVTYNLNNATSCYGVVIGNINEQDASVINARNWGGTDWQYLDGTDSSSGAAYQGISFTVTATSGTEGTWRLTATDTNGPTTPLNLPATFDLAVALKASDRYALWYYDNVPVHLTNNGEWEIEFKKGKNHPDFSHMVIFGREGYNTPPSPVPVPAAAWLLGSGLIGLAGFARRRVTAKVA